MKGRTEGYTWADAVNGGEKDRLTAVCVCVCVSLLPWDRWFVTSFVVVNVIASYRCVMSL